MPWEIKHSGCPKDKPIAVVRKDTGKVVGCHDSEASAKRQLAALYASERAARIHADRMREVCDG